MVLARTSKLQAVNKALQMMGESPLNSLQGLLGLGNLAEETLDSVSRKVQAEGWSFNTDYQMTLTRDSTTNQISVGTNVSRVVVDPYEYYDVDVVQRGSRLYDRKNNTYVFDEDLTCNITYFRNFDEIPESARRYINIRAARVFVDRLVGDDGLRTYTAQDEARARANLMENDMDNADHNVLSGDPNLNNAMNTFTPADVLNR